MTADEYVPSEDLIIEAWKRYSGAQDARYARLSGGDAGDEARRFLARVRRDAKAEGWDEGQHDLYLYYQSEGLAGSEGRNPYRDTHYPEESP